MTFLHINKKKNAPFWHRLSYHFSNLLDFSLTQGWSTLARLILNSMVHLHVTVNNFFFSMKSTNLTIVNIPYNIISTLNEWPQLWTIMANKKFHLFHYVNLYKCYAICKIMKLIWVKGDDCMFDIDYVKGSDCVFDIFWVLE